MSLPRYHCGEVPVRGQTMLFSGSAMRNICPIHCRLNTRNSQTKLNSPSSSSIRSDSVESFELTKIDVLPIFASQRIELLHAKAMKIRHINSDTLLECRALPYLVGWITWYTFSFFRVKEQGSRFHQNVIPHGENTGSTGRNV